MERFNRYETIRRYLLLIFFLSDNINGSIIEKEDQKEVRNTRFKDSVFTMDIVHVYSSTL